MGKKRAPYIWVSEPQAPKFTAHEKTTMLASIKELIRQLPKVSKKVSRVEMRANRIYLYELVEQSNPDGALFTKPLIDGKYLEYPYARITVQDTHGNNCTVDWQRHTNQWMTLHSGNLAGCMKHIETDECRF